MEERLDDNNGEGSFRRQQQWWRKLRITTSWAEEASEVLIDGGGNCSPHPRWWKELHTEAIATKGTTHES